MNKNFPYPHFVDVGNKEEFLGALTRFSKKVENVIKRVMNRSTVLIDDDIILTSHLDIPLLVLGIETESQVEFLARNILVANIMSLEKHTSLGAHIYCLTITKMCDDIKRHVASNKTNLHYYDHTDSKLKYLSRRASVDSISKILKSLIDNSTALQIFDAATSLAGAEGHITIKDKSKKFETVIEVSNMFKFAFGLDINFVKNTKFSHMELENPRIIIIDGFFEAAFEIERFLFYASKKHESLIVVARGFSEEVTVTLARNFVSNNTQVFPISVPYDMYGANALKDLACIVGNDVVSPLKGELISSVHIDEHKTVEKAVLSSDKLSIKEQRNLRSVKNHLDKLTEKQLGIQNDDIKKILQKRIKTLLSRHVEIRLGKDVTMRSTATDHRLRKLISIFNEVCRHGIIEISDNSHVNKSHESLFPTLQKLYRCALPAHSLERAIEATYATKYLLMRTGAYVISSD